MSDPSPSSGPVSADSAAAGALSPAASRDRTYRSRSSSAYFLILASVLAFPAVGAAAGARAKAVETFERAVAKRAQLESRPDGAPPIGEYLKLIQTFQAVYRLDPTYRASPAALADAAELYREVGRQFSDDRYYLASVKAYQFLIAEFPRSALARDALFGIGEIYGSDLHRPDEARRVYRKFLERYPSSTQAAVVRERLKEPGRLTASQPKDGAETNDGPSGRTAPAVPEAPSVSDSDLETQPPPEDKTGETTDSGPGPRGLTQVTGVRCWVGSNYTRVVITLEDEVKFKASRVPNPDRLVFDLSNTHLSRALVGKTFPVEDGFLRQVRIAQYRPTVTRAVLDVRRTADYSVFSLPNPFRLVIDIRGKPNPRGAEKSKAQNPRIQEPATDALGRSGEDAGLSPTASEPAGTPRGAGPASSSSARGGVATAFDDQVDDQTGERLSRSQQTSTEPSESNGARRAGGGAVASDDQVTDTADLRPPSPPALGASPSSPSYTGPAHPGSRTLTRALGLKIGKIVIDPGHGGHDTGTVGPRGLREKDLVLDVALRLRALIERKTGAEVVMTRSEDTFIPLEERTAIANQKGADLFISIHANASRDPGARGIETYYLNFTTEPHALEVAARENASSAESVHQLQTLVKKIVLTEKINESREFAAQVQRELYSSVTRAGAVEENRGVKRAPFVVLIGASMPSVLAEISFVTNPRDERLLRRSEYRQKIAEALYRGIVRYTSNLGGLRVAEKTEVPHQLRVRHRRRASLEPAATTAQSIPTGMK